MRGRIAKKLGMLKRTGLRKRRENKERKLIRTVTKMLQSKAKALCMIMN